MYAHINDLRETLSQKLLGSSYDPKGYTPEHVKIRKLAEVVMGFDLADVTLDELRVIFRNNNIPDFDLDQWLLSWVEQGVYDERMFNT
jgi:hypothetical protein